MIKKQVFILVLFLLVLSSGIGIASAETLTGILGENGYNQSSYTMSYQGTGARPFNGTKFTNFENTGNLFSIVRWGPGVENYDINAPAGTSTPVTIRLSNSTLNLHNGRIVGTGFVGYQRFYNKANPPVETTGGFQFLQLNSWDIGNETGTQYVYFDYNPALLYNFTFSSVSLANPPADKGAFWNAYTIDGNYLFTKATDTWASYTVSKPSGLSIQGVINKSESGSFYYNSRGYILNENGSVVTSQGNSNPDPFNFNVPNERIKLAILAPSGIWYNSSTLFTAVGAVTPTPTPTPTVTLNPGEFWLTFSAEDATTGGLVPGAEIDIYSQFAGTWNNATTSSGERTIASSQGHVYNAYGSASGYTNGSALDKIAYPNQNYLVKLFPSTGLPNVPGYVNLFVSVTERETGSPISGVSVTVSTPGSFTVNGETDNTGSEVFSTSNSSVKYITVSKSGYKSETRTITTPASGSYNAALQMSRVLVTTQPTSYIPPGGVTPQITVDPRSSTEKDQDMMNMIRDNGPSLIQLAIVVTMISLLGLMTKGFK